MSSEKVLEINAKYNGKKNILTIAAELPTDAQYALRVFRDELKSSETLYRSTRLLNLEHTKDSFNCEAPEAVVGKTYELKNIRTNTVVATGEVVDNTPAEENKEALDAAQS